VISVVKRFESIFNHREHRVHRGVQSSKRWMPFAKPGVFEKGAGLPLIPRKRALSAFFLISPVLKNDVSTPFPRE
jgi:hypothetical protein